VRILANDRLVHEATYTEDLGQLVGIRYRFLGAGQVDYWNLETGDGEDVYSDEFNGSRGVN
jgi:hypothetical protein